MFRLCRLLLASAVLGGSLLLMPPAATSTKAATCYTFTETVYGRYALVAGGWWSGDVYWTLTASAYFANGIWHSCGNPSLTRKGVAYGGTPYIQYSGNTLWMGFITNFGGPFATTFRLNLEIDLAPIGSLPGPHWENWAVFYAWIAGRFNSGQCQWGWSPGYLPYACGLWHYTVVSG